MCTMQSIVDNLCYHARLHTKVTQFFYKKYEFVFFKQNETLAGVRSLCVWTTEACFWEFSCTHDAEEEGVCFKQASNHFYIFF